MSAKFIPLEQACDFLSGYAWSAAKFETDVVGLPIIRIQNVDAVRESDFVYWGEAFDERFVVREGDLLLTLSGSFRVVVWPGPDALLNQRIVKLMPKKGYSRDWLLHVLRNALSTISNLGRHALVSNVALADLRQLQVPLQTADEQRRIAAILDQAETLRTQRRTALAQIDSLTQSLFLDMFGDTETILKIWPVQELGGSLDFMTSGSRGWATYYAESGDLFLRIQNVRRDELSLDEVAYVKAPDTAEARRTLVQPGDVLLSITADLGRTAVVPDDIGTAFINQHLSILRTKAFIPRFLSAYLASPIGQRQVMGRNKHAVKAGLNFDDIRSFQIPHPPLPLQQTFATRIQAIEALKATHRSALTAQGALFASLQQRAFAGHL